MTPKAGRELDARVAVEVMGFPKKLVAAFALGPPEYSTQIRPAWEVVEKLLGLGYTLELYSPGALINDEFGTHSVGWGVEFCTWSEPYLRSGRVGETVCHAMDEKSGGAAIETATLAICLAALKAVE